VLLSVSIVDADGGFGHGEAAPLQQYDGVSVEQVERALESYEPVLARGVIKLHRAVHHAVIGQGYRGASVFGGAPAQMLDAARAVQ